MATVCHSPEVKLFRKALSDAKLLYLLTNQVASWRISEKNKHGGQTGGRNLVLFLVSEYEEIYDQKYFISNIPTSQ